MIPTLFGLDRLLFLNLIIFLNGANGAKPVGRESPIAGEIDCFCEEGCYKKEFQTICCTEICENSDAKHTTTECQKHCPCYHSLKEIKSQNRCKCDCRWMDDRIKELELQLETQTKNLKEAEEERDAFKNSRDRLKKDYEDLKLSRELITSIVTPLSLFAAFAVSVFVIICYLRNGRACAWSKERRYSGSSSRSGDSESLPSGTNSPHLTKCHELSDSIIPEHTNEGGQFSDNLNTYNKNNNNNVPPISTNPNKSILKSYSKPSSQLSSAQSSAPNSASHSQVPNLTTVTCNTAQPQQDADQIQLPILQLLQLQAQAANLTGIPTTSHSPQNLPQIYHIPTPLPLTTTCQLPPPFTRTYGGADDETHDHGSTMLLRGGVTAGRRRRSSIVGADVFQDHGFRRQEVDAGQIRFPIRNEENHATHETTPSEPNSSAFRMADLNITEPKKV